MFIFACQLFYFNRPSSDAIEAYEIEITRGGGAPRPDQVAEAVGTVGINYINQRGLPYYNSSLGKPEKGLPFSDWAARALLASKE